MKALNLLNSMELDAQRQFEKVISAKGAILLLRLFRHLKNSKDYSKARAFRAIYGKKMTPANTKNLDRLNANLTEEIEEFFLQKGLSLVVKDQPSKVHLHYAKSYSHSRLEEAFYNAILNGMQSAAARLDYETLVKLLKEYMEFLTRVKPYTEVETCSEVLQAAKLAEAALKYDVARKFSELQKFTAYSEYMLKHHFNTELSPIRETIHIDLKVWSDDYSKYLDAYARGCHHRGKQAAQYFSEALEHLTNGEKIIPSYADDKFKMFQNVAVNYALAEDYDNAGRNFEMSWIFAKESKANVPLLARNNYLRWLVTKMPAAKDSDRNRAAVEFYNLYHKEFNSGEITHQARALFMVAACHLYLAEPHEALGLLSNISKKDVSSTIKLYYHWLKIIAFFDMDRMDKVRHEGTLLKSCWESIVELDTADSDLDLREISEVFFNFSHFLSDASLSASVVKSSVEEMARRVAKLLNTNDPTQRTMLPLDLLKSRLEARKRQWGMRGTQANPEDRLTGKWTALKPLPALKKKIVRAKKTVPARLRISELIKEIYADLSPE